MMLLLSLIGIHMSTVSAYSTGNINNLSKNDQLFREDIQYRLDKNTQGKIYTVIGLYKTKIATLDKTIADNLTDRIIGKIDTLLYKMSASEPLDKSLGKRASGTYLAYTLLKFELMMLK